MTYTYRCADWRCFEQFVLIRPMEQRNDAAKCPRCGASAVRDIVGDHGGTAHHPGCWPLHSNALRCVDGEQVQRNTEFDRLHGVPTDYDSQCRPVFSGPEHKKRYYEAHGYRDPLAAYNGAHGRFNRGEPPPPPQDDRADKAAMKETLKRRAAEMGLRIGAR